MKKGEINEYIKDRFKKIRNSFINAIDGFKTENIREFRSEIKNSKSFCI